MQNIPTDPKKLKSLIDRRHPEFKSKLDHWKFLYSTYLGEREWFKANIFKFNREGSETYQGRVSRAYRFNHTREVVDLVNKYLFKHAPLRKDDANLFLERFRESATLGGLSVAEFERQVGRMASIFGRIHVVVDNSFDDADLTVAEQKRSGGQLYAYVVLPHQFLDCAYDNNGQYEWVLLEEAYRDDADPFESSGDVKTRYRLWTKSGWALFGVNKRGKVELLDSDEHSLGVVPVIKCDHIESDEKYVVPALIEDIAYLDRAIANYLSNLDQIINDQTFSQLVMPGQSLLNAGSAAARDPDGDHSEEREQERRIQKMGTSQILIYDGEHGSAPAYISPDPRQASLIVSTITKIINEIYHTVGLAGERTKEDNAVGIDNSSGVAKAFDFERVNALLSAKASAMQAFSNRLETLVCIYAGETLDMAHQGDPTVLYSSNFDVRGLADELKVAHELSLLNAPAEVRKLQMQGLVEKLWPLLSEKVATKLKKAVDDWDVSLDNSVTAYLPSVKSEGTPGQGAVGGEEAAGEIGN